MNLLVLAGIVCIVVVLVKFVGWLLTGVALFAIAVLIELA